MLSRLPLRAAFAVVVLLAEVRCAGRSDTVGNAAGTTHANAGNRSVGNGGTAGAGDGAGRADVGGGTSVGGSPSVAGTSSGGGSPGVAGSARVAAAGDAGAPEGGSGGSMGGTAAGGHAGEGRVTGCNEVSCTPRVLSGSDSLGTPPNMGDICNTPGSASVYCLPSDGCPGESDPYLFMCCDFGDGAYWANSCANLCEGSGNEGGQGGQDASSAAGHGGEGNSTSSCVNVSAACCSVDADCPSGFECAPATAGGNVCEPRLADRSECWRDSDCPAGFVCFEAEFCGCGAGPCADGGPGFCIGP